MRSHSRLISPNIRRHALALLSLILLGGCAAGGEVLPSPAPLTPVPVDFTHTWTKGTHPFTGAAVIDVEGDGRFEVFIGDGEGQRDALLSYRGGRLVNIEPGTGLSRNSATYGNSAIDLDADGDTDLIVAREDGVLLSLNDKGRFHERPIPVDLPADSVPFSVAVADIDHDGDGDLYISVFVNAKKFRGATFNDPMHAKPNRLLLNKATSPLRISPNRPAPPAHGIPFSPSLWIWSRTAGKTWWYRRIPARVVRAVIQRPTGHTDVITAPTINTTIRIHER